MYQYLLQTSIFEGGGVVLVILFLQFLVFCFLVWVAAGIFGMRTIVRQNKIIISILSTMEEQQGVDMKKIKEKIHDEL